MQMLEVGQEMWGFIAPEIMVDDLPFQKWGSVTRLPDGEFLTKLGGFPDGTVLERPCKTQKQGMGIVHLPLDGELFSEYDPEVSSFRIKTVYDGTTA
jgi:hypothetical protein